MPLVINPWRGQHHDFHEIPRQPRPRMALSSAKCLFNFPNFPIFANERSKTIKNFTEKKKDQNYSLKITRFLSPLFPLARTILVFKQQQWKPGNQIIQVHEYTRILFFRRWKKRKREKGEKSSLYECCMHNCRGNILARTLSLPSLSAASLLVSRHNERRGEK